MTAISQPERLAVGDYAHLVDAAGDIREAVAVLAFDAANASIDLARGVLDTTPQSHASGTHLIGVGEWIASEGAARRVSRCSLARSRALHRSGRCAAGQ